LLGIILSLEQSTLGIAIGARFPDFRETIRSRYVGVTGSLVGVFLGLIIAGLTMSPIFVSVLFFGRLSEQVELLALVFGIVAFLLILRFAEREFTLLLRNIRI
jgi:MFS family permease